MRSPKSGAETPTLSAHKYKTDENLEKPRSESRKKEQLLMSAQLR